jgi:hypothetical protein
MPSKGGMVLSDGARVRFDAVSESGLHHRLWPEVAGRCSSRIARVGV